MQFTKMHGAGNDYVYVDCFQQQPPTNPAEIARQISDRHTGIGADGLILICPSKIADAQMRMFNADGSESEMCGNGIRCVAKYLVDYGICAKEAIKIETGAGILALEVFKKLDKVHEVRVDMGEPILQAELIPTLLGGNEKFQNRVVDTPLEVAGRAFLVTSVSMGNPHCVIYVDEATDELVHGIGPKIESDARFPARVNVEFVELVSSNEVRQRTWERGSGETMACGTVRQCRLCCGRFVGSNRAKIDKSSPGRNASLGME